MLACRAADNNATFSAPPPGQRSSCTQLVCIQPQWAKIHTIHKQFWWWVILHRNCLSRLGSFAVFSLYLIVSQHHNVNSILLYWVDSKARLTSRRIKINDCYVLKDLLSRMVSLRAAYFQAETDFCLIFNHLLFSFQLYWYPVQKTAIYSTHRTTTLPVNRFFFKLTKQISLLSPKTWTH